MPQPHPSACPLSAFPGARATLPQPLPALARQGYSLRQLELEDLPWLKALYASTRADEMATVPWSNEAKRAFLDQQFALQHQHYINHFTTALFLAIEHPTNGAVGRLYLQCSAPRHLLIDICLMPSHRQQGIGSAIVRQCQNHAAARGHGMALHVQHGNFGAQRLYQRLGFSHAEQGDSHCLMVWAAQHGHAATAQATNVA